MLSEAGTQVCAARDGTQVGSRWRVACRSPGRWSTRTTLEGPPSLTWAAPRLSLSSTRGAGTPWVSGEKLRRNLADTEQGTRESVSEYDPTQSYPAIKA